MPEKPALDLLKSIREALKLADERGTLRDAAAIMRSYSEHGRAKVVEAEHGKPLEPVVSKLEQEGFLCNWNLDPISDDETPADEDDGEGLSEDSYHTAMVLMAMTDGNPLTAALNSSLLATASGDEELYTEVVVALCRAFPFLAEMLRQQGVVQDGT